MGQNLPISVLGSNSQPLRYDLLLARSGMLRLKRERGGGEREGGRRERERREREGRGGEREGGGEERERGRHERWL